MYLIKRFPFVEKHSVTCVQMTRIGIGN